MRFSNPAAVASAALARVTTDSAGAPVRALLGAGASGAISADLLEPGSVQMDRLPVRPFVALALGPAPDNGAYDQHALSWWIYDDVSRGHSRIGAIAQALMAAFDTGRGAPVLSVGPTLPGTLGEPRIDSALGLRARRLDLTIHA